MLNLMQRKECGCLMLIIGHCRKLPTSVFAIALQGIKANVSEGFNVPIEALWAL